MGASHRDMNFGDMMVRDEYAADRESSERHQEDDTIVDIGENEELDPKRVSSKRNLAYDGRRHTISLQAEEDVCFPSEAMSEMADDDMAHREGAAYRRGGPGPRRRRGKWPDLAILDEWSRFEIEGRSDERRAKRITEPQLIGGRLRPVHKGWHRAEDDAPYRFTYFNEEFQSTIHSQTISELVQPGGSFRELFMPDPPELTDLSSEEEDDELHNEATYVRHTPGPNGESRAPTRNSSLIDQRRPESRRDGSFESKKHDSRERSGQQTPKSPNEKFEPKEDAREKPKRYGERPTWWLDVLSPTDAEMKVLAK